jgi:hypothetical protein
MWNAVYFAGVLVVALTFTILFVVSVVLAIRAEGSPHGQIGPRLLSVFSYLHTIYWKFVFESGIPKSRKRNDLIGFFCPHDPSVCPYLARKLVKIPCLSQNSA